MKKAYAGIGVVALVAVSWWWYSETSYQTALTKQPDASKKSQVVEFQVKTGMTVDQISSALKQKNLVVDDRAFTRYLKSIGGDTKVQATDFYLNPALTIPEVVDILMGKVIPDRIKVTIPEGYTIDQIGELFAKKGIMTKEEYSSCLQNCPFRKQFSFLPKRTNLEGYFFPDTYYLQKSQIKPNDIMSMLLSTFEKRIVNKYKGEIASSKKTLDELVNMASIIERESRPKDDQAIISGILWKRIANNVQLATDATLRYNQEQKGGLTVRELLDTSNPYNTRKLKGLPPTPIANPGEASFDAALHPKDSPYWYYLHDTQGQIYFAATEREHEVNKRLYLSN